MGQFLDEVSPCDLLDIGCGTGRALEYALHKDCRVTGLDVSEKQLAQVRDHLGDAEGRLGLVKADMRSLPFEDSSFDAAMMIASVHHLMSGDDRLGALREALRVVRSGGSLMVSVWTWDQERFRQRHLSRLSGREPGPMDGPGPGDFLVPWKDGIEVLRSYHLYGPGELEVELREAGWNVVRAYFDGRNHWAEARR
jgi:SAM-dependent methyltransferase